ncbi:MAG: conserved membrane protein of unknown function [Promethearchaeota archaeon]|nr:MAG: conserved membrane protein of unknown function [Candidatus Lokiarchaeota archaeon]
MVNIKTIFKYAFKDLKTQKVRTILGTIGILISVGLLALVLFLADSISMGFVDYLSIDAGDQDLVITVRHYNGEPSNRSSFFAYNPIIDEIRTTTSEVQYFIPRMEVQGDVNISEGFGTRDLTDFQERALISGINFSLESQIGFGTFLKPDENEDLGLEALTSYNCAIYYGFNDEIKYKENETIQINFIIRHGDEVYRPTKNFTIQYIFDYNLKWPANYRNKNLICVNIETLYEIFSDEVGESVEGTCYKLISLFRDTGNLYDIRDVSGSEERVVAIASSIQLAIGLEEYNIELPKLEILSFSEILSMIFTIAIVFVSIIAMLISGILINGILKTSVEERIREFGIFRTLGAHKYYNLAIVILQGFLLCNFGTISGIVLALVGTRFLIIPFANSILLSNIAILGGATLSFNFTFFSILLAYLIGISVGFVVSISPAVKVMRLQIIESIHPYRHEDTLYKLQKKSSVNMKLIITGIILALNGGFIYLIIPRILISADLSLMAGTMIIVLMIFLIGVTLAGIGLMPIVLKFIIGIFRPIARRLKQVVRIFVYRYQRRNTSTIIIFALSFSFVIFTSILLEDLSSTVQTGVYLNYGSDLLIESNGWEEDEGFSGGMFGGGGGFGGFSTSINLQNSDNQINPDKIFTTDFEEELLTFNGIERISSVLIRPYQLNQLYSQEEKEFMVEIGDYAGLSTQEISLIGIDERYHYTVDNKYLELTRGDMNTAFQTIQDENKMYCVISESIAIQSNFDLGDKVRIVIHRGEEIERFIFTVVGMASSIPGFSQEFTGSASTAGNGGVLVSHENYLNIMEIPEPTWVDRFFIRLREDYLGLSGSLEESIDSSYKEIYNYDINNLAETVERQEASFSIMDTFFMLILAATVVICLFGLLSSSYSSIIERKKEIGIIRTLGLKGKEINRLFILEALIIMLSSGTVGVLVGWATGWLFGSSLSLLSNIPYQFYFPWTSVITIYSISALFIYFGMKMLLRKARKKKIVEIYRETM